MNTKNFKLSINNNHKIIDFEIKKSSDKNIYLKSCKLNKEILKLKNQSFNIKKNRINSLLNKIDPSKVSILGGLNLKDNLYYLFQRNKWYKQIFKKFSENLETCIEILNIYLYLDNYKLGTTGDFSDFINIHPDLKDIDDKIINYVLATNFLKDFVTVDTFIDLCISIDDDSNFNEKKKKWYKIRKILLEEKLSVKLIFFNNTFMTYFSEYLKDNFVKYAKYAKDYSKQERNSLETIVEWPDDIDVNDYSKMDDILMSLKIVYILLSNIIYIGEYNPAQFSILKESLDLNLGNILKDIRSMIYYQVITVCSNVNRAFIEFDYIDENGRGHANTLIFEKKYNIKTLEVMRDSNGNVIYNVWRNDPNGVDNLNIDIILRTIFSEFYNKTSKITFEFKGLFFNKIAKVFKLDNFINEELINKIESKMSDATISSFNESKMHFWNLIGICKSLTFYVTILCVLNPVTSLDKIFIYVYFNYFYKYSQGMMVLSIDDETKIIQDCNLKFFEESFHRYLLELLSEFIRSFIKSNSMQILLGSMTLEQLREYQKIIKFAEEELLYYDNEPMTQSQKNEISSFYDSIFGN